MKLGSLFSGAGGLDLAVEEVLGCDTVWHAETDPAAARVLTAHWPGVPNLGDVTAVDWTRVEPVDVICGGSPCQDVSHGWVTDVPGVSRNDALRICGNGVVPQQAAAALCILLGESSVRVA